MKLKNKPNKGNVKGQVDWRKYYPLLSTRMHEQSFNLRDLLFQTSNNMRYSAFPE